MRAKTNVAALIIAMFIFGVSTTPCGATPASSDACSLVTQGQVSADVGVSVGPGQHVMPTAVKTCTWTPADSTKGVKYVTVSFWDPKGYDGGKRLAEQMAAQSKNDKDGAPMTTASASGENRVAESLQLLSEASIGNGTASAKPAILPSSETTAMRFSSPRLAVVLRLTGSSGPAPEQ